MKTNELRSNNFYKHINRTISKKLTEISSLKAEEFLSSKELTNLKLWEELNTYDIDTEKKKKWSMYGPEALNYVIDKEPNILFFQQVIKKTQLLLNPDALEKIANVFEEHSSTIKNHYKHLDKKQYKLYWYATLYINQTLPFTNGRKVNYVSVRIAAHKYI